MKKNYILVLAGLISFSAYAQTPITDFEDLNLQPDSFWNGSDLSGQFVSNSTSFSNVYDTSFGGFWSGMAYSTMRDTSTAGFGNQYSCIAGSGYNNSLTYAVYYNNSMELVSLPTAYSVTGIWVNNSTYAYLSMKNGDSFSKKFGDSTNASGAVDGTNGNDFFKLTILGTNSDSVEFYLADFRGPSSTDYIIKDWTFVDLSALSPNSNYLKFKLSSSDNNSFGMVTPAYFCMDNIGLFHLLSVTENSKINFSVFPNPTHNSITIKFDETVSNATYKLIDMSGREVLNSSINGTDQLNLDLSDQKNGLYVFVLTAENEVITKRIVKQ